MKHDEYQMWNEQGYVIINEDGSEYVPTMEEMWSSEWDEVMESM
jgi:hypothetical protein